MNNTDFFNNHRAEALKLIAESIEAYDYLRIRYSHNKQEVWMQCEGYRGYTDYNPCANTTEGKAQLLDLIMELRAKHLAEINMTTGIDKIIAAQRKNALTMFYALQSPEAACIARLDMIRKV